MSNQKHQLAERQEKRPRLVFLRTHKTEVLQYCNSHGVVAAAKKYGVSNGTMYRLKGVVFPSYSRRLKSEIVNRPTSSDIMGIVEECKELASKANTISVEYFAVAEKLTSIGVHIKQLEDAWKVVDEMSRNSKLKQIRATKEEKELFDRARARAGVVFGD